MSYSVIIMRSKKFIIISFCLSCSFSIFILTKNSNTQANNSFFSTEEINTLNIPTQWYLKNSGTFNEFQTPSYSWLYDETLSLKGVDINISSKKYSKKRPITVALIDTSVDINHVSISDNIWCNPNEIIGDKIDNDGNGYIDDINGWNFINNTNNISYIKSEIHGTAMASLICGYEPNTFSNAYNTKSEIKLMCLRTLQGNEATGNLKEIIAAIKYAEENGAFICCLSFETYMNSDTLYSTLKNSNMLFIVSSGNDGIEIDNNGPFPSAYELDNVLTVADLREDGKISYTSNYSNKYIDIAAPGTDIACASPQGGYSYVNGSSCSAAIITGGAAYIYQCSDKELSAPQLKECIINNVTPSNTLSKYIASCGYFNLEESLKSVCTDKS